MNPWRWSVIVGLSLLWTLLDAGAPNRALGAQPAALESQLLKGEAPARIEAAKKLAVDKDPNTAGSLLAALKDSEPLVKRFAVYGLQRIGERSAAAKIAPLVTDKDPWVRRTAIAALGRLGAKDNAADLLKALKDEDVHVRCDAFIALGRLGDPATQKPLLEAMQDKRLWSELDVWDQMSILHVVDRSFWTDQGAAAFLKTMVDFAKWPHPELAKFDQISRDARCLIISNGVSEILATKFHDAAGEDWLIKGLSTEDDFMQQSSTKALGQLKSKKAVPAIVKVFDGNPAGEKWANNFRYAIEALGEIGDQSAVPALEKFLTHADFRMRSSAAAALLKIDGKKREIAPDGPAAAPPKIDEKDLGTPGNKHPPQFICLGVDDCANVEGIEAMLDVCETLRANGSKAVFTMWLAPLAGDWESSDMEKKKVIYQRLFDLGCEIAHHTLHHNPGGQNWSSLPRERQVEEIEGCTKWYRDNIVGFTRPFAHKGGGGGHGTRLDMDFTRQLVAKQNFLYGGRGGQHPNDQKWPTLANGRWSVQTGTLDAGAPPVHAAITDTINSDYPGRFDYDVAPGVAMWKGNFEYHYNHPRRPILAVNAFHDWGFKTADDSTAKGSNRNEGTLVKEFLLDVLVKNKAKYPDTYCVTYSQLLEYVKSADLKHALAAGNCQDSRNPEKPTLDQPQR